MPMSANHPLTGRLSAIESLKRRAKRLRNQAKRIEKFIKFLKEWEKSNGRLEKEIEEMLWEISHELGK